MDNNNKVLIVEDDKLIREIFSEILAHQYDLTFATTGDEAIDILDQHIPAIIILDVMIPGVDGFDVLKYLRNEKKFNKTIVIMVTALSDEESRRKAIKLGADEFIVKPFNIVDIKSKVKLMMNLRKRFLNECKE